MDARRAALWKELSGLRIDDEGAAFTFEARLAAENGWEAAFARRVIEEYRRFLYLMLEAGHPVTPSDQVDQAWHLHLTYTRSYWERLCRDIAGRSLHHDPTRGGKSEQTKFDDWYARTLESYARHFGLAPPGDIWPPPEVRFGIDPRCVRVNTERHWVVNKGVARRWIGIGAAAAGVAALGGCGALLNGAARGDSVRIGLLVGGMVLVFVVVVVLGARSRSNSGCGGSGCGLLPGSGSDGASGHGSHGHSDGGHSDGGHGGDSGCGSSGCGGGGCGGGGD